MDERRCLEVLRAHNEWRRYDGFTGEPGAPAMVNPTELGQALDHAIATIERVVGAHREYVCRVFDCNVGEDRGEVVNNVPVSLAGRFVRLVPDPQPDGQEGAD